jgi:acetyltransferase-like isoleucine patch superfamily enzyme
MSTRRRNQCVALVVDEDLPLLCRRPAVDWLMDSVDAVAPTVVAVIGPGQPWVQPALPDQVTLVLPASLPLLRAPTLRRALNKVRRLVGDGGAGAAVLIDPVRTPSWWAQQEQASAAFGLAVVGDAHVPVDVLAAWCVEGDRAALNRHFAASGVRAGVVAVRGVPALWLGDPLDRTHAENALYAHVAATWVSKGGVTIDDLASTRIDATVRLADGVHIRPHTELAGETAIGRGSRIGPMTTVRDSHVGAECQIQYSVCQDVSIGDRAIVGPFAWLRSGTRLGERCRAGAFVELADSVVGEGTSIPHLGGLFSADVGRNCNIAGLSGPANTNNGQKNRIRIGDDVFIGAGNILVAPVTIGDGSATAAGSVITEDVPSGALGMARVPQHNVPGWAALQRTRREPQRSP